MSFIDVSSKRKNAGITNIKEGLSALKKKKKRKDLMQEKAEEVADTAVKEEGTQILEERLKKKRKAVYKPAGRTGVA